MKKKYIIIAMVLSFILLTISISVNFGLKVILMSERKNSQTMLEELWYNFGTDYSLYQDLPTEEVTIKSHDNLSLKGLYHNLYPTSKKVVIINHGYTANKYVGYQFTDIFFEEGYNVLLIDMRSHGESEGDVASYGYNESKDLNSWVNYIKNKVGDDAYVGLHGQSMGAASVMLYGGTHEDKVKFVIEDCGFTTAREAIKFQFKQAKIPFWPLYDLIRLKAERKYNFDLNEVSPKEAITTSTVPILFIHGTNDTVVPSWMAEELFESKKGEKDKLYLVEGANHMESYSIDKKQYKKVIRDFLDSL